MGIEGVIKSVNYPMRKKGSHSLIVQYVCVLSVGLEPTCMKKAMRVRRSKCATLPPSNIIILGKKKIFFFCFCLVKVASKRR